MAESRNKSNPGRIRYATETVPREIISAYQNKIGKAIIPPVISTPGFEGRQKTKVSVKIKMEPHGKALLSLLSVIDKRN